MDTKEKSNLIEEIIKYQWAMTGKQGEAIITLLQKTPSVDISKLPLSRPPRPGIRMSNPAQKFIYHWDCVGANPSEFLRSKMIKGYFEYAAASLVSIEEKKAQEDSRTLICINKDKYSLYEFISRCIEHAENRPADKAEEELALFPRYFTVTGAKGAGKTFLQNFIAASFGSEFDEKQIVWVCVNMVRNFHTPIELGGGINLHLWINAQIAKVLCRHYDTESEIVKNNPGFRNTRKLVSFRSSALKNTTSKGQRGHIEAMLDIFYGVVKDVDLDHSWINSSAVMRINQRATEEGFKFIVVLDGLDLLTHSELMRKKCDEVHGAVHKYLCGKDLGMFHLVFLREESLEDFQEKVISGSKNTPHENRTNDDTEYCVIAPNIHNLYSKRIKTFTNNEVFNGLGLDMQMIEGFDNYVKNGGPSSLEEQMRDVEKRFGSNTRSAVQLLNLILYRHLQQVGEKHEYHLTEIMMLGRDNHLPIQGNTYTLDSEHMKFVYCFRQRNAQNSVYDTNFLPVIFHYPFDKKTLAGKYGVLYGILIGVRVLQALRALRPLPEYAGGVSTKALELFLVNVLDIPSHVLETVIYELLDYDVIAYVKYHINEKPKEEKERAIELTPKGTRLLEGDLYDLTYLFLSAYSTPLPVDILAKEGILFPYSFPPDTNPETFSEWVVGKIHNGFLMANLIEKMDHRQRLEISRNGQLDSSYAAAYNGLFGISRLSGEHCPSVLNLHKKVTKTAEQVLHSISDPGDFSKITNLLREPR
jgi:hypothetical protein